MPFNTEDDFHSAMSELALQGFQSGFAVSEYIFGKVYGIYYKEHLCYVGSTKKALKTRKSEHGKHAEAAWGDIIKLIGGIECFQIKLIDYFPCRTKIQLLIKESQCINQLFPLFNLNMVKDIAAYKRKVQPKLERFAVCILQVESSALNMDWSQLQSFHLKDLRDVIISLKLDRVNTDQSEDSGDISDSEQPVPNLHVTLLIEKEKTLRENEREREKTLRENEREKTKQLELQVELARLQAGLSAKQTTIQTI